MSNNRMRFGLFMAPFHRPGENPTLALERDLDLAVLLDRLGFDELWVGEHHSGGTEIIPSPELFLAVAAERTRSIRLGTGVISVPYHNPFMVAARMAQLDHLTRGRVMLGFGPGQLASDAHMLNIPTDALRDRMQEGIDVIVRLLRGETVTVSGSWFTLNDAHLHLTPYSDELELAVTGTISTNGARAAGRHGIGLLSMAATTPEGMAMASAQWAEYERVAKENGHTPDRSKWRCVGPVHIAPTREEARREVAYGFDHFARYFRHVIPGGLWAGETIDELLASNDERGTAIIGTPEDAIEKITELQEATGGFGAFTIQTSDWADTAATRRSLELFARHVIPHFNGRAEAQRRSWGWVNGERKHFARQNLDAIVKAGLLHEAPRLTGSGSQPS